MDESILYLTLVLLIIYFFQKNKNDRQSTKMTVVF